MGKRGNLTLDGKSTKTLVQFGDIWVPAHLHPGQYLRGRYGPNYLKHAQSWRFVPSMNSAFDSYSGSAWTSCQNSNQACLENYPMDGNYYWLPHRYP